MAFLNVGKAPVKKQRLYLLDITLPSGVKLVKIGKASGSSSKERMMQINGSIFDKLRSTAMIGIKRDREVPAEDVFKMESCLHRFFKDCQYQHVAKFDGITECFMIPLEDGVAAYEAVLEGLVPEHTYVLPKVEEDDLTF